MELSKERSGVELKFFEICQKVVPENGLKLYDLEYQPAQQLLRIYVYDETTKTAVIEDCVKVDRALTPYIEEESWIPDALVLEVSSPGIYRHLSQKEHFEMSFGEMVLVTLRGDLDAELIAKNPKVFKNKKLRLELLGLEEENVEFAFEDINFKVPLDNIKKIILDPEL